MPLRSAAHATDQNPAERAKKGAMSLSTDDRSQRGSELSARSTKLPLVCTECAKGYFQNRAGQAQVCCGDGDVMVMCLLYVCEIHILSVFHITISHR